MGLVYSTGIPRVPLALSNGAGGIIQSLPAARSDNKRIHDLNPGFAWVGERRADRGAVFPQSRGLGLP